MPRIYTSQSDPIDFCNRCFPQTEKDAFQRYGQLGDGPDSRGNCFGYQDDHPDYSELDYTCEKCGKLLTDRDN
jgi:hypothetical protein